jgi:hypothetical protein
LTSSIKNEEFEDFEEPLLMDANDTDILKLDEDNEYL